jgi:hypothetical protein
MAMISWWWCQTQPVIKQHEEMRTIIPNHSDRLGCVEDREGWQCVLNIPGGLFKLFVTCQEVVEGALWQPFAESWVRNSEELLNGQHSSQHHLKAKIHKSANPVKSKVQRCREPVHFVNTYVSGMVVHPLMSYVDLCCVLLFRKFSY